MASRESELLREWRESVLKNEQSFNDRLHKVELEMAVIKVKFAVVGMVVGIVSSVVTTIGGAFLMKIFRLN